MNQQEQEQRAMDALDTTDGLPTADLIYHWDDITQDDSTLQAQQELAILAQFGY